MHFVRRNREPGLSAGNCFRVSRIEDGQQLKSILPVLINIIVVVLLQNTFLALKRYLQVSCG